MSFEEQSVVAGPVTRETESQERKPFRLPLELDLRLLDSFSVRYLSREEMSHRADLSIGAGIAWCSVAEFSLSEEARTNIEIPCKSDQFDALRGKFVASFGTPVVEYDFLSMRIETLLPSNESNSQGIVTPYSLLTTDEKRSFDELFTEYGEDLPVILTRGIDSLIEPIAYPPQLPISERLHELFAIYHTITNLARPKIVHHLLMEDDYLNGVIKNIRNTHSEDSLDDDTRLDASDFSSTVIDSIDLAVRGFDNENAYRLNIITKLNARIALFFSHIERHTPSLLHDPQFDQIKKVGFFVRTSNWSPSGSSFIEYRAVPRGKIGDSYKKFQDYKEQDNTSPLELTTKADYLVAYRIASLQILNWMQRVENE